jgi:hypothetical protein
MDSVEAEPIDFSRLERAQMVLLQATIYGTLIAIQARDVPVAMVPYAR